jgi:NitT/TauT family transport system permease protein
MTDIHHVFLPNKVISKTTAQLLVVVEVGIFFLVWLFSPFVFLPTPSEVFHSFGTLWADGLGAELETSIILNLEAIGIGTLLSLAFAYATVLPIFRPIVAALSKLRFLSLIGLTFFVTVMTKNGHQLKLSLLVFSMSVFFVTGMADVLANIPREKFDLARTLRMNEWRVVWEVVVLGQVDKAFEVLRQNAAIGWMMLTMIEGMSRSDGGIGALLLNQNKHFHLSAVFAIQLTILALGLAQDYIIGLIRGVLCPYADLAVERK